MRHPINKYKVCCICPMDRFITVFAHSAKEAIEVASKHSDRVCKYPSVTPFAKCSEWEQFVMDQESVMIWQDETI